LAEALTPSDLESFIEAGERALHETQKAMDHLFGVAGERTGIDGETLVFDAASTRIHAPKPRRGRVAFCGGNFPAHAAAMASQRGGALGEQALDPRAQVRARGFWGSWKIEREAQGPDGQVIYPNGVTRFDYEGELAIVLGRRIKNVKAADAPKAIWGVTLFTDWSARDYAEPAATLNFAKRKNFDTCYSLGPCIVVGELDAYDTPVETFVNGERRQSFSTRDMAFSFGEFMEYLSHGLTLYPGDIIASGTGPGTAMDSSRKGEDGKVLPDLFLKPGDSVEVRSPNIGVLRSKILPADPE
jgi:2-keto-4-pentenoate hydratase/2-oxohepta-3-ene-1,7-dioic acid hydratase in catechol pathway